MHEGMVAHCVGFALARFKASKVCLLVSVMFMRMVINEEHAFMSQIAAYVRSELSPYSKVYIWDGQGNFIGLYLKLGSKGPP